MRAANAILWGNLLLALLLLWPSAARAAGPQGSTWSRLDAAPLTFHFEEVDARTAAFLAERSPGILSDLVEQTGLPVGGAIDVTLSADPTTFRRVQPSEPPLWAVGTAWTKRSEIYLYTRPAGSGSLEQVLTHELVHILLGRAWKNGSPPRWLNEGLARYLSRELSTNDHVLLARAAVAGRLLPLEDFSTRWPTSAGRAHLAYVQAVDFVSFVAGTGKDVLPQLLERLAGGEELSSSIHAVTGESLGELEERWRARITFWHGVFPVLGSSSVLWGLTSILFLYAGVKRRRQIRRKLAAMGEREGREGAEGPEPWRQGLLAGHLDPARVADSSEVN